MRVLMGVVVLTALTAAPVLAQERKQNWQDAGAYITGMGGVAVATGNMSGDMLVEAGVRVVPHVMVFGNVGYFKNLQGDLQPTLNATATALSATQGLTVVGGGTLPAWYTTGGLRAEVPTPTILLPYVLGSVGVARLNPNPQFTFASGTLPDGSTPTVGQDVTSSITSFGVFTPPPSSTALMVTVGGGVQVAVAPRWVLDAGYRYSRIAADSTLSASPLNTNGVTFGLGYRF